MFDGSEFLDVADQLARMRGAGEGHYRSAISRAYYASFLVTRTFCHAQPSFRGTGTAAEHELVPNFLERQYPNVAKELRELRRLRRLADYDLDYGTRPYFRDDVQLALDIARGIVVVEWIL